MMDWRKEAKKMPGVKKAISSVQQGLVYRWIPWEEPITEYHLMFPRPLFCVTLVLARTWVAAVADDMATGL